jgi:hypothetical protein
MAPLLRELQNLTKSAYHHWAFTATQKKLLQVKKKGGFESPEHFHQIMGYLMATTHGTTT